MSSAAAAGNRAFGVDRGLPFPLDRPRRAPAPSCCSAPTSPRPCRRSSATWPAPATAGGLIVVDPRRSATAQLTADGGGLHLQPAPGTDLTLLLGLIPHRHPEDLVDTDYIDGRTTGFDALRRSVDAAGGPSASSRITGVPVATAPRDRPPACRGAAAARYILTGRGVEQHVDGTDTATAAINLAPAARPAPAPAAAATARSPARATARAAASTARRPTSSPATARSPTPPPARTWPRSGVSDPAIIPGPGVPAVELLGMLGAARTASAASSCTARTSWSPAPDATAVSAGLAALDFLVVCDFFLSETGRARRRHPAGHAVGRGGGDDDQPRGARPPPPPGDRPARPGRAANCGSWRELARRLAAPSVWPTRTAERLRGAARAPPPAASPTTPGIELRAARPRRGRHWPYPGGHRRHAAAVPGPLRPPRRPRPARGGARRVVRADAGRAAAS